MSCDKNPTIRLSDNHGAVRTTVHCRSERGVLFVDLILVDGEWRVTHSGGTLDYRLNDASEEQFAADRLAAVRFALRMMRPNPRVLREPIPRLAQT